MDSTHWTARARRLSALLALVAVVVVAKAATTITLKPTARLSEGADVTLADIATLVGPDAQRLGALVVMPADKATTAWQSVDVKGVRAVLDQTGVNWSKIVVRGSSTRVRHLPATPPQPTESPRQAEPAPTATPSQPAANTVRSLVPGRLALEFGVPAHLLRVSFSKADDPLLGAPTSGRRVELTPIGRGDRVPIRVTIYDSASIATEGVLRVGVLIERDVPIATKAIRKGARLALDDMEAQAQWLPPSRSVPRLHTLIGATTIARIAKGDAIDLRDIATPSVIERGDRVFVHVLSGAFVVRTEARAMADGAAGDVISFEALDRSNRRFQARIDGPGRAVLDVNTPRQLTQGAHR